MDMKLFYDALFMALIALTALAGLFGLICLIAPAQGLRLHAAMSRGVSLRKAGKPWEQPRSIERWIYRHHWLSGALIIVLATLCLAFVLWQFEPEVLARRLLYSDTLWLEIVLQTAGIVLGLLAALAWIIGAIIVVRPSLLKPIEAFANRWVSTRRMSRPLHAEHDGLTRVLARAPRLLGLVIVLLCLILLVALAGIF